MFDLNSLAINLDAQPCELRHPNTGEILYGDEEKTKPWTVYVYGLDSEQHQKYARKFLNARANSKQKNLRVEDAEKEAIEQLIGMTERLENIVIDKSKPDQKFDATRENLLTLYSDRRFRWARDQIEAFIADRSNFLPA